MAQADGIHIELLHPLHVEHHIGLTDHLSGDLVKLMEIHPLKQYGLAIDHELPVLYFAGPETNFYRCHLRRFPGVIFHG